MKLFCTLGPSLNDNAEGFDSSNNNYSVYVQYYFPKVMCKIATLHTIT